MANRLMMKILAVVVFLAVGYVILDLVHPVIVFLGVMVIVGAAVLRARKVAMSKYKKVARKF